MRGFTTLITCSTIFVRTNQIAAPAALEGLSAQGPASLHSIAERGSHIRSSVVGKLSMSLPHFSRSSFSIGDFYLEFYISSS